MKNLPKYTFSALLLLPASITERSSMNRWLVTTRVLDDWGTKPGNKKEAYRTYDLFIEIVTHP